MGKVTIIVESDDISTDNLTSLIENAMGWEGFIRSLAEDEYQVHDPDVRVYVVPSD